MVVRNNYGRLTAFRKGGGHKRKYRLVDFKTKTIPKGVVKEISYDPNRTAFIAEVRSVVNSNDVLLYVSSKWFKRGDIVESGKNVPKTIGNTMPLRSIPVGTLIHNIELKPGAGGQYARAAGTFAIHFLQHVDDKYGLIRLKSREQRLVLSTAVLLLVWYQT